MKNWNIKEQLSYNKETKTIHKGKYLLHSHKGHEQMAIQHDKGHWYCLACGTIAPEGMGYVAELAKCIRKMTTHRRL